MVVLVVQETEGVLDCCIHFLQLKRIAKKACGHLVLQKKKKRKTGKQNKESFNNHSLWRFLDTAALALTNKIHKQDKGEYTKIYWYIHFLIGQVGRGQSVQNNTLDEAQSPSEPIAPFINKGTTCDMGAAAS